MPRRVPTLEQRILSALRVARRPLSVAMLRPSPGLTGRRTGEVLAACVALVARGELVRCQVLGPRQRLVDGYGVARKEGER